MPWLDRIDEREARRMARKLGHSAAETGSLASDLVQQLAQDAGAIARRAVDRLGDDGREQQVRQLARTVRHGAHETGEAAREHLQHFAQDARHFAHDAKHAAGQTAHQLADYGRREGALLAQVAAQRALKTTRAVKADPVPVIVGVIGLALLANLVFSRRSRTTTRS